jgi:hypothetical protein
MAISVLDGLLTFFEKIDSTSHLHELQERRRLFEELEPFIPNPVLLLAERENWDEMLELDLPGVRTVKAPWQPEVKHELDIVLKVMQHNGQPKVSVREAFSCFLLRHFKTIKNKRTAQTRRGKKLPRATIARAALMVLSENRVAACPQLYEVLSGLMDVPLPDRKSFDLVQAKGKASFLLASLPDLSLREVAKTVGVNVSTLSRWLKQGLPTKDLSGGYFALREELHRLDRHRRGPRANERSTRTK